MRIFPYFWLFSTIYSYKILVYNPKVAHSHIQFMGTVADTLQASGHQVLVLQPEFTPHVTVNGSKLARIVTVKPSDESFQNRQIHNNDDYWEELWNSEFSPSDLIHASARMLKTIFTGICKNLLKQTELIEELKAEKFDLAIVELLDFSGIVMAHVLDIPTVIGASSLGILEGTAEATGLPLSTSFVPASHGISPDSGSFYDRLVNLIYSQYSKWFQHELAAAIQAVANEHVDNPPDIWETVSNMPLLITNSDPLLDFPRPTYHKIIDVGGLGVKEPEPLPKEFDEILSRRPRTVLISFGTIVFSSKMPKKMKDALVGAIKNFPNVTFIWKYETPEDGPKADNLILTPWMPQNDLLADPRVVLFIGHGGVASTYEAATRGVPMILVPNFGDQMRNAQMIKRLGFGIIVQKRDLRSREMLTAVIEEGLTSQRMKQAAATIRSLLQSRPFPPSELLVRHVELVAKFGSLSNLSSNGRHFSLIRYYNIDIFAFFGVIIFVLLFLTCKFITSVCKSRTAHAKSE